MASLVCEKWPWIHHILYLTVLRLLKCNWFFKVTYKSDIPTFRTNEGRLCTEPKIPSPRTEKKVNKQQRKGYFSLKQLLHVYLFFVYLKMINILSMELTLYSTIGVLPPALFVTQSNWSIEEKSEKEWWCFSKACIALQIQKSLFTLKIMKL